MTVAARRFLALFCLPIFLSFAAGPVDVVAQDITLKRLDHDAYDRWNTLTRTVVSENGKWIMYVVQNGAIDGDSSTHFVNSATGISYSVTRAASAVFSHDSRFAIFRLLPEKKKGAADKDEEQAVPPKVQYLELPTGKLTTIDGVRSFGVAEENGRWLACLLENRSRKRDMDSVKASLEKYEVTGEGLEQYRKPLNLKSREKLAEELGEKEPETNESNGGGAPTEQKEKKQPETASADGKSDRKKKQVGNGLLLVDLLTGVERQFPNVLSFEFSKDGKFIAFNTSVSSEGKSQNGTAENVSGKSSMDTLRSDAVHLVKLEGHGFKHTTLMTGSGEYGGFAFSDDSKRFAFVSNHDDYEAESPAWNLYLADTAGAKVKLIAGEGKAGVPNQWWIAPDTNPEFSEDQKRLYFDTAPIPPDVLLERSGKKKVAMDKSADIKKPKLDLWHWKDPQLQPQQLLQAEMERKRRYRAAYVLKGSRVVQLATRQVPTVNIDYRSGANIAVANSNLPYRKTLSWDYPGYQDIYLVNLDTGARRMVAEKVKWSASLSPEGKYLSWFDAEKKQWFAQSTRLGADKPVLISTGIRHPLQDELHDTPNLARAYGAAGWIAGDTGFVVYDRYDLWRLDPSGKMPSVCLTGGIGRKQNIRFRYLKLDSRQRAIDPSSTMMLSAFQTKTKASGFYSVTLEDKNARKKVVEPKVRRLLMLDERVTGLKKAKKSDRIIFTRSSFRTCEDVWTSTLDFREITRVSDINPQQDEYSWGTAELVHWRAKDGQKLDGILLKPDDFDPARKYPMMVYFYERNSDNLHRYYTPAAGRSIICHSFYVSRGYVVFIPDIPYKTGEPGPSAVNAIVPGVEHLIRKGFIDEQRIGMQGHSWGGYQTAYLVTQTDMFACAESGAPVSNMTSAYGGIRWGSGLSRMFQYERTQSRIGEDLWSARDKYVANSPLFFADRINTPLLILHNDEDGAVPWYQGIELFVALRRLGKPAWMLNYNGEPHWVMDEYNRRDFAKRMQQFFDHYLMDAPEPEWMAVGIPAVKKGENFGLELLEPESVDGQSGPE